LDSIAAHTYQTSGTYTIAVTVTDTGGLTSIATRSITAGPSAPLPPVADGIVGGPAATFTPGSTVPGQIDVTYDVSACSGQKAIILYGDLGDYSGYRGCAQSDAGHAGTATIDASSLNNVWFNIVWTHVVPDGWVAGHPGYGYSGTASVPRSWNAAGFCGVTEDNHGDGTCTDNAPVAALTVTPDPGPASLAVTADASASTDGDSTPIAGFMFDFGDGNVVGPQAGAAAPHTYASSGTYTVTVTVTDTAALSSTATAQVTVSDNAPVAALTVKEPSPPPCQRPL
jgi:PKD repeat protein